MTTTLVVEDSPAMRALTCDIIENIGFKTIAAESGEEALDLFQKHPIDLVVLDVGLPGIDGFETCRKMRQVREDWFPVVYLSASSSDEYVIEGLEAGGDAYVNKPVNTNVLQSIVRAMGRISDMKNKLAAANAQLEQLASIDGLTQIPNRRSFDDALERYWRQAQRNKTDLGLLLIDVDHFKPYNDNYGHLQGDDTLQQVAKRLKSKLLRPFDMCARYGGEEFAVLLPEVNREGTLFVAKRLLKAIQTLAIPHEYSTTSDHITASIGIAFAQSTDSTDQLIKNADKALYQAKEAGRNQLKVFE
ncbi:diguanylate cyclase [Aliikangiella marina]|uniref:diguanylate cyclase n=1 Tax=Aliikangiella marina TaxID=1712262 RepID=A0A545T7H2_9GAMM|nr:diguanylate cyclase [Aliikangiella marina]TQV73174.1 diguanylate cyclase [Aliikangiella marina]